MPVPPSPREPIAIVGIGCRFPQAGGPRAFWSMLSQGRDAVTSSPGWEREPGDGRDPRCEAGGWGGWLTGVDGFDWRAFRIPPREARYLDPQHRLLLEVAWEALEDAGIPLEEIAGTDAGVFVALMWNDYLRMHAGEEAAVNGYSATGNVFAFAPGRVSYTFDLRGPSVAIDGACAGSLASVHEACNSLWLGECELCLAGGVNLMLSPKPDEMLRAVGVLSPTGRCRTLDAEADGFVRGEGAGLVVLKPLSRVRASDRIYALIRGGAVTHNGHTEWIMAASPEGQRRTLERAYAAAGVDPARVDYVELHGTGLPKGDPIETAVVGEVVGQAPGRSRPCAVGSVKSNIGHLDSAAGIAGLIKAALALRHRTLAPTIHLDEINPGIDPDALGIAPQRALAPWPPTEGPAYAGVSAVSMTGLNAHIVLEGPAPTERELPALADDRLHLLPLSAPSPASLVRLAAAMADQLEEGSEPLIDVLYTAAVRRTHHPHRLAVLGRDAADLAGHLRAILDPASDENPSGAVLPPIAVEEQDETIRAERDALAASAVDGVIVAEPPGPVTLRAAAELYVAGHPVDWRALQPIEATCVSLPTTPWIRTSLWLDNARPRTTPSPGPDARHAGAEATAASGGARPLDGSSSIAQRLAHVPDHRRLAALVEHVRGRVATILGLDGPSSIDADEGVFDLGMTSLSSVELAQLLGRDLGTSLPETLPLEHPTARAMASYLLERFIDPGPEGAQARTERAPDLERAPERVDVDQLSEEEAEALLRQRLRGVLDG